MSTLYKVLGLNGQCYHGGQGTWHLPYGDRPGRWMPRLMASRLEACIYGYHLLQQENVIDWLGPTLWEAEGRGKCIERGDKIVIQQARLLRKVEGWNSYIAAQFAADCAERVLLLFERALPDDNRPREAIMTARQFAAAAYASARAAYAAAYDAAYAAANAANAAYAARAAAYAAYAARAAGDAARAAYAARAADVAGDAAYAASAAANAAYAAGDAAYAARAAVDAAYAARAAGDAADVTYDAAAPEREWQTERLFALLA